MFEHLTVNTKLSNWLKRADLWRPARKTKATDAIMNAEREKARQSNAQDKSSEVGGKKRWYKVHPALTTQAMDGWWKKPGCKNREAITRRMTGDNLQWEASSDVLQAAGKSQRIRQFAQMVTTLGQHSNKNPNDPPSYHPPLRSLFSFALSFSFSPWSQPEIKGWGVKVFK